MDDIITRIKLDLRITHSKLDSDVGADIAACLADLKLAGVTYKDETDPLIFNAIKLWCRSLYTDDIAKSAKYMERYEALKASLMMADGYCRPEETDDE